MSDSGKLKPLAEQVLISEIVFQLKLAEKAAEQLINATDSIETWSSVQSILVATANVSKILWPANKKRIQRGKQLRSLLGVNDLDLLSDRTFRNHFEHYDERIEDWFNNNSSAVYTDLRINPFGSTPFSLPRLFHRSYDPTTQILTFRDESIDLKAVLAALSEIKEKCRPFALV